MAIKTRRGIQKVLINAWQDCIWNDYVNQVINSERSLQASFWSAIKNRLPANRFIFIEPTFKIEKEGRTITPDILICNRKEVIAIVELKYLPRGKSHFHKDVHSLNTLAKYRKKLVFKNMRYMGQKNIPTEFPFSSSILFVWAGIYNRVFPGSSDDFSKGKHFLRNCYMQLDAVTEKDNEPTIYQLTS